jgi:hypothetical protein
MSPFATTSTALRLTPLWSYSAKDGASVKALLHVDTTDLTFVPGDDGRSVATTELVGVVVAADGSIVTGKNATMSVSRQRDDTTARGVTYSLVVPVPRPGGYQLRFAVRDTHSGAVGSVGEFVEVPDVSHGAFALSSVVLGADGFTGAVADDDASTDTDSAPAVRQFSPGGDITYSYEIYNADGAIDASASVWRDGKQVLAAPPPSQAATMDSGPLRAIGALHLDGALTPGDYVLQIDARNATGKKPSAAATRIDFRIR